MSHKEISPAQYPQGQTYLVVANAYPSQAHLYRNGFIHRRVLGYIAAGERVRVFYLHPPVAKPYKYEFEGVEVLVGNEAAYRDHLSTYRYKKILVHFASPDKVLPVRDHQPETPVITWIHGFEAEAWHRRWFNLLDSAEDIKDILARRDSHFSPQLQFLNWFYQTEELDTTFVHVSDWFKRYVAEPDARASTRNAVVIPNVIDENLFDYRKKTPDARLRILSVRPYASHKYANDLAIGAVLELSNRPYFHQLEFSFFGDGKYFDTATEPLRGMPNVRINKTFLTQTEIANEHKSHGIFLAPTRFDSQGVSMCEAMSSGLVPVTTNVAAIPEFVSHRKTGMLARPESSSDIAEHVEALYYDPELYLELSQSASRSIVEKCGINATITPELELLRK